MSKSWLETVLADTTDIEDPASNPSIPLREATAAVKGVVQLAGDLGGTAAAPTVTGGTVTATGSTSARTLRDRFSDVVHVLDFVPANLHAGIQNGTNTTDLRAYIQAAVDRASALGGATVYMPRGVYRIEESIIWKTKVSLCGDGPGKTVLKMVGVLFSAIEWLDGGSPYGEDPAAVPLADCAFEDFEIDGSALTYASPSVDGKGIFILYMDRALFRNLYIHDCIGTGLGCDFLVDSVIDSVVAYHNGRNVVPGVVTGGQSGIGIGTNRAAIENVTISNCHTNGNGNYGIFVEIQDATPTYSPDGARIVNCFAEGNQVGFGNVGSGRVTMIGLQARANTKYGYYIQGTPSNTCTACVATDSGDHAFVLDDVAGGALIGCEAKDSGQDGIQVWHGTGHVRLLGCETTGNGRHGVNVVDHADGVTLADVISTANTSTGLLVDTSTVAGKDVYVSGGIYARNGRQGILITGGASGLEGYAIRGATVKDNGQSLVGGARQGISMTGIVTSGIISGNWFGNSVGATTQSDVGSTGTTTDLKIIGNTTKRHASGPFSVSGTVSDVLIRDNDGAAVTANRGDASVTLTAYLDPEVNRWEAALTANRTVTLSTTGASAGARFRVVRTGLGAFALDVGGLKTIPNATAAFVDVEFNGTAWALTGYGAL